MDNFRPELNTGRSVFHVTHVVAANAIYELPFGNAASKWLNSGGVTDALARRVAGRLDPRVAERIADQHLLRRAARSTAPARSNCGGANTGTDPIACNTAFSTMSAGDIKKLLGIYRQPDGRMYWIDPKVIDSATGRAVGADNSGNTAGVRRPGVLQSGRRGGREHSPMLAFDGPSQFRIDMALSKRIRFLDRYGVELKGEAFNLTNTPSFSRGDMDINSTTFGRLTSVNIASRVVQLSVRFDF